MTMPDPAVAELVREVLAEELARLRAGVREERVRIADDADLAAFARQVLAMADDRAAREALESGRLVFRLDGSAGAPGTIGGAGVAGGADSAGSAGGSAGSGGVGGGRGRGVREATVGTAGAASPPPAMSTRAAAGHTEVIERGLFSERHAERLSRDTVRVRLGRKVRMTPLARDRLRRRGIAIERTEQ